MYNTPSRRDFLHTGLYGALRLGGAAIGLDSLLTQEYKNIEGKVYELTTKKLIFVGERGVFLDEKGVAPSPNLPVLVTRLGVESKKEKYDLVLFRKPDDLLDIQEGDNVSIDYLVDEEITGREILKWVYPEIAFDPLITGVIDQPAQFKIDDATLKADGYVIYWWEGDWKKEDNTLFYKVCGLGAAVIIGLLLFYQRWLKYVVDKPVSGPDDGSH